MQLDFEKLGGIAPVVVQDDSTGEVLMLAFMNQAAWDQTRETGFATFWSRSRGKLWLKGESSGHRLRVVEARTDCDQDALILKVKPSGPGVCHEGFRSCFSRRLEGEEWFVDRVRMFNPDEVYA